MELSQALGIVPLVAKVCPKCVGGDYSVGVPVVPTPIAIEQHKTWCSVVKCNKCNFRWYVCRKCTFVKSVLDTMRKLNSHAAKYHSQGIAWNANLVLTQDQKRNRMETQTKQNNLSTFSLSRNNIQMESLQQDTLNDNTEYGANDHLHAGNESPPETPAQQYGGTPTAILECAFSQQESQEYFANNHHRQNGAACLILRSFYANNKFLGDIKDDDLKMCLKMALLVKTMTERQSEMFWDFMEVIFDQIGAIEEQWTSRLQNVLLFVAIAPVLDVSNSNLNIRLNNNHQFQEITWRYNKNTERTVLIHQSIAYTPN
jgi:hypothetical protein